MKKFALILMLAAVCQMAGAQSSAAALRKKFDGRRATFEYTMTIMEKVPVKHMGTVLLDGNFYRITDNGLEYRCDGKTRWTIDESSKEVYIEESPGTKAFLAAPAEYVDKIKDLIVGETTASGVYSDPVQGVKVTFVLTSIKTSAPTGNPAEFTLDTSSLGKQWVVTDLR